MAAMNLWRHENNALSAAAAAMVANITEIKDVTPNGTGYATETSTPWKEITAPAVYTPVTGFRERLLSAAKLIEEAAVHMDSMMWTVLEDNVPVGALSTATIGRILYVQRRAVQVKAAAISFQRYIEERYFL